MQGRVVQWWDGVLFFIIGLTTTLSLHVAPSSTRLLWIGLATMGIGSLLSVLLLILCAVLSLTFTPILLTEMTQAHGYPAILVPFWLTGLLWMMIGFGGLGILLIARLPGFLTIDSLWGSLTMALIGVALSWTASLWGSLARWIDLRRE